MPSAAVIPTSGQAWWARHYADELGWFLLPLHGVTTDRFCTCRSGANCTAPGKHPLGRLVRHGIRDASRDVGVVESWWTSCPWANIGMATGPSAVAVLDVDPRNGGEEELRRLVSVVGQMPLTLISDTGSGGEHHLYRDPCRRVGSRKLVRGLDVKARGGLLVAPPSLHHSGRRYSWANWGEPLEQAPEWLADVVLP